MRTLAASGLLLCASSIAGLTACRINVDNQGFIEREQKRFAVEGVAELSLYTFDGAVEVRGWDRPEVVVEIEKRAEDKEAVDKITVLAEQTGKKIQIDVRHSGTRTFVGIGSFTSPSARLIVNAPHKINLEVRTADGSIVVERLEGKLELRTADGRTTTGVHKTKYANRKLRVANKGKRLPYDKLVSDVQATETGVCEIRGASNFVEFAQIEEAEGRFIASIHLSTL